MTKKEKIWTGIAGRVSFTMFCHSVEVSGDHTARDELLLIKMCLAGLARVPGCPKKFRERTARLDLTTSDYESLVEDIREEIRELQDNRF